MGKVFPLDQVLYPSKYCFQQFWKSSVCHNVTNEIYKIHQSVHATKNKEEDLPLILRLSCNLGNLESRLVSGEHCKALASFFGLRSNKMHSRKHCVRGGGIQIDQEQICYICSWLKSLTKISDKLIIYVLVKYHIDVAIWWSYKQEQFQVYGSYVTVLIRLQKNAVTPSHLTK